jgi:hypothetical protein
VHYFAVSKLFNIRRDCWGLALKIRSKALRVLLAALAALAALPASANAADKSAYTLANPTPESLLRDLTTDRPDLTESPFTVDAGRIQIESNLYGYAKSRPDEDGITTQSHEFAIINIRAGVTHNTEIDLIWQPYGVMRFRPKDKVEQTKAEGIGGLVLRGKLNLYGNDKFDKPGDTALALLPFISIPTDRGNGISPEDVEGGLIVPFAVVLPVNFGLGLNAGVSAIKDDNGKGYHAEAFLSAALAYEWNDRVGTYYEIAAILGTDDPRGDTLLLGTGFTYAINDNTQLDGGINFGVTPASDRWNPFVGLTRRF